MKQLQERIAVSNHREAADIVIKNGKIVNVFSKEIMTGDIAIKNGYIAGIGEFQKAKTVIDAKGKYLVPGFIDSHVHVESAMVTPAEFARVLLPNGVTTIVTDPHEIANVAGEAGITFMLENAEGIPLDMFVMLPSSVPATQTENNGAELKAKQLKPLYAHPKVIGLAEVMDFPSVASGSEDILQKILDAKAEGGRIDGHGAGLHSQDLNNYLAAGIRTDHESTSAEEALDRLRAGMYVMLREGTVGRDLKHTLAAVNETNSHRFCFCTDDKLISDIMTEGSINYHVKMAIASGMDPITAIQLASINAATCHQLPYLGAIAAGYQADILFMDDLTEVSITDVMKKGELVVADHVRKESYFHSTGKTEFQSPTVRHQLKPEDLELHLHSSLCNVIGIRPNQLFTDPLQETVSLESGQFMPSIHADQQKMVVVERHKNTGNVGLGIVKGFGLQKGAIATTVAHDSHNIVAVGADDDSIMLAIETITEKNGGIVVVADGKVLSCLPLPIAGLLSDDTFENVQSGLLELETVFHSISIARGFDPFLTLSFLTLPVIPTLKLTDNGLFDFEKFQVIPVEVE